MPPSSCGRMVHDTQGHSCASFMKAQRDSESSCLGGWKMPKTDVLRRSGHSIETGWSKLVGTNQGPLSQRHASTVQPCVSPSAVKYIEAQPMLACTGPHLFLIKTCAMSDEPCTATVHVQLHSCLQAPCLTECREVHGCPEDVAGGVQACRWGVVCCGLDARDQVHQRDAQHALLVG